MSTRRTPPGTRAVRAVRTVVAVGAAAGVTLLAGRLLRRHRWHGSLHRLSTSQDAHHLRGLCVAGLLTRAEATRIARWSRAYPPGSLVLAVTTALCSTGTNERAAVKRDLLGRVAAQVGPYLPTGGRVLPPPATGTSRLLDID